MKSVFVLIAMLSPAVSLAQGLYFVPTISCRVVDTRGASGPFGGPYIASQTSPDFAISSGGCGIPSSAQAYSLNVTIVPHGGLGYLAVWTAGQPQPGTSTLNSNDGRIVASAAIVASGTNGAISVFASDDTDVIVDINGYFASDPTQLSFFTLSQCRVADTRTSGSYIAGGTTSNFSIVGACGVPGNAQAYLLNMTALPRQQLGYMAAWAAGQPQPGTSTLNAWTGAITANAAVVSAGSGGQISVFASNDTDLLIDVSGYFAPSAPNGLALYPMNPCRVIDTRASGGQPFSGTVSVNVGTSACGLPASAQAYVLAATVLVPVASRIWPCGPTGKPNRIHLS